MCRTSAITRNYPSPANCRMCLVQVEKAPKPLPACATPVTEGMKVFTASEQAKKAQQGVMEFLLINHPLDCPICDQGRRMPVAGPCRRLRQIGLALLGREARGLPQESRSADQRGGDEPLHSLHALRALCQEIAGVMELGMGGRGEHSEILSFVGKSIDSELSGNMIDVCPVGALTSKPFRYSARTLGTAAPQER